MFSTLSLFVLLPALEKGGISLATNQIGLGRVFGDPCQLRQNRVCVFTIDMISKSAETDHVPMFTRDTISKIEGVLSLVKKETKARK